MDAWRAKDSARFQTAAGRMLGLIRDYSRREWSGMLNGFYLKRWEKFYAALAPTLTAGGSFDQTAFDRELQDWERRWADEHAKYPGRPRGNSLAVSRRLWSKYEPQLAKSFEPEASSLTTGKPANTGRHLVEVMAFE